MLDFPRWKAITVIVLVALSILYALPNLYPKDPAIQITANRGAVIDAELQERIHGELQKNALDPKQISIDDKMLMIRMANSNDQLKASDLIRPFLGSQYTVAMNLAPTTPAWLEAVKGKPAVLGLDLQGGVYFLMEVDQKAALDKRIGGFVDDIRAILRKEKIRYTNVTRQGNNILVELRDASQANEANKAIKENSPELQLASGGTDAQIVATVNEAELKTIVDNALEQNIGTLRKRIDELGVAEPVIQRQGNNRIVVQLPGVQDTAQAKKILGATATLEYRAVVDGDPYEARDTGNVAPDARLYYQREIGLDGKPMPILLSKRTITTGDQLVDARSGMDPESGTPMVSVKLNNIGGSRMFDFTSESVGKLMAVVYIERRPETTIIDGKEVRSSRKTEEVISAATIQGVFSKNFQTTGLGSVEEAAQLALMLRAGSLAAPVDIVQERVIGPSMGAENVKAGTQAIIWGLIMVCVLMIIYYRLFGVVAVIALATNLIMLGAILSVIGATLTMPGIAGIVLTLGMAIDGNVLIGERIREEIRNGLPPIASIKGGYEHAWTVILDSNVTKVIAAFALYSFGSGPVRGFATVLFFGVLTSMFTSVTLSRALMTLIYGRGKKPTSVSV